MVPTQKVGKGNKLAILFPRMGYNLDKPLLYCSKCLLLELGWQIWGVAYDHRQSGDNLEQLLCVEVNEVLGEATGKFAEYLSDQLVQ
jgi:hypothetical protein